MLLFLKHLRLDKHLPARGPDRLELVSVQPMGEKAGLGSYIRITHVINYEIGPSMLLIQLAISQLRKCTSQYSS